jgi:autotransporter-associated beta strand protein
LTKLDPGQLLLTGVSAINLANSYAGPTLVRDGTLWLAKDNGIIRHVSMPGNLTIGDGLAGATAIVRVVGGVQFANFGAVTVGSNGQLSIDGAYLNTIGSLVVPAS